MMTFASNYTGQQITVRKTIRSAHFCIGWDEIDDYYERIQMKGAIIDYPLGDRVYGIRDCQVNSSDGNTIVFGKVPE